MIFMDIKKIIIGTGSYDTVKSGNCVSVTGDGGNAWGFYGQAYKKLAPRLKTYLPYAEDYEELKKIKDNSSYIELKKEIEDKYINSYYETRLKDLDVYDLLSTLYNKYGDNIILLCHEPIDEFCHRRLIADYIELKTGIIIPEVIVDEENNIREVVPINYKDRLRKVIEEDSYKNINDINELIKIFRTEGKRVKGISDGHHTFEDYIDMRNNLFIALCNAYPDKCWKARTILLPIGGHSLTSYVRLLFVFIKTPF